MLGISLSYTRVLEEGGKEERGREERGREGGEKEGGKRDERTKNRVLQYIVHQSCLPLPCYNHIEQIHMYT